MSLDLPMPWQRAQWQRIAKARAAGRLPHALLLSGAAGTGKSHFARVVSAALVCPTPDAEGMACGTCPACRQARAGSHPDQLWLLPDAPGKMIKIDAVRALGARSVLAAQENGFRVIVIDPADAMNRAAANALLKTLEEPTSRSVLILVSSRIDLLPATVRSRCQQIDFPLPPRDDAVVWLSQQLPDADVAQLLPIAGGAPLAARRAAEEDWPAADAQMLVDLSALRQRKGNPLDLVEKWNERPINRVFDSLKRCFADLIRVICGDNASTTLYHPAAFAELQSLGQGIDLRLLYELNDDVLRYERAASNNLNPQMMLESLVNRWLNITRPGGR